jgi:nitroreductase
MNTYELIMKRRSVRNFKDKDIPDEILDKLLDAIVNAPSGGNIQPISVILVKDTARRNELSEIVGDQPWVRKAPLSMIFCIDFARLKRWAELSNTKFLGEKTLSPFFIAFADLMCAAHNVVIMAESLGLGSVYIGTILSGIKKARDYFMIPEYVLPMMVLSIGYPAKVVSKITKLRKDVMIHNEIYRELDDDRIKSAFGEKYGSFEENIKKYFERSVIDSAESDKNFSKKWFEMAKEQISKLEIKNNAQFLFDFKYPSESMLSLNRILMESFKNAGFDFFDFCKD